MTVVEEYGYYHGTLDPLVALLERESIRIWNADFTQPASTVPDETFALVTNMAMVEHLPDSPKPLMENLRRHLDPDGTVILEVPNIAYWFKRLEALRGRTVHAPLEHWWEADRPYLGHHREYTEGELRELLLWSGLRPDEVITFNYSLREKAPLPYRLRRGVGSLSFMARLRSFREVLMARASRAD